MSDKKPFKKRGGQGREAYWAKEITKHGSHEAAQEVQARQTAALKKARTLWGSVWKDRPSQPSGAYIHIKGGFFDFLRFSSIFFDFL